MSLSLAMTIRQTLESELYEVVHPKKLHILHKREIQNNQTEKHGKEVSSGLIMVSSNETEKDLSLAEVMSQSTSNSLILKSIYTKAPLCPGEGIGFL